MTAELTRRTMPYTFNPFTGNFDYYEAGVDNFLALTDTPGAYAGNANMGLEVNPGANALQFVERGWEVISQQQLVLSATSITYLGLDLDADWIYDFHVTWRNSSALANRLDIRFNNDNVLANYWTQYITADAAVLAAGRLNLGFVMGLTAGTAAAFHFTVQRDPNGYTRWLMKCGLRWAPAVCGMRYYGGTWVPNVANVTRIDLVSINANGIGGGSQFTVFRLRQ